MGGDGAGTAEWRGAGQMPAQGIRPGQRLQMGCRRIDCGAVGQTVARKPHRSSVLCDRWCIPGCRAGWGGVELARSWRRSERSGWVFGWGGDGLRARGSGWSAHPAAGHDATPGSGLVDSPPAGCGIVGCSNGAPWRPAFRGFARLACAVLASVAVVPAAGRLRQGSAPCSGGPGAGRSGRGSVDRGRDPTAVR